MPRSGNAKKKAKQKSPEADHKIEKVSASDAPEALETADVALDIASANSDMEAAAEEVGARPPYEPVDQEEARIEQAGGESLPDGPAGPIWSSWPNPAPTSSRFSDGVEEAAAFFGFTRRFSEEFGESLDPDFATAPVAGDGSADGESAERDEERLQIDDGNGGDDEEAVKE